VHALPRWAVRGPAGSRHGRVLPRVRPRHPRPASWRIECGGGGRVLLAQRRRLRRQPAAVRSQGQRRPDSRGGREHGELSPAQHLHRVSLRSSGGEPAGDGRAARRAQQSRRRGDPGELVGSDPRKPRASVSEDQHVEELRGAVLHAVSSDQHAAVLRVRERSSSRSVGSLASTPSWRRTSA
jgi:hypothetical protein